jgi:hypothetical protein
VLLLSSEIFFVDFLPKLLEDIINISFSDALPGEPITRWLTAKGSMAIFVLPYVLTVLKTVSPK